MVSEHSSVTILDKYMLRTFIPALVAATVTMLFLYCTVDFFQRVDRFMKLPAGEIWAAVGEYYLFRIPVAFVKLSPMIGLAAAMITILRFLRANELMPMAASGINLHRGILPVFLSLGLVMACVVLIEEFVVPACAHRLVSTESKLDRGRDIGRTLVADNMGNKFFMSSFEPATNTMRQPMVNTIDKEGRLTGEIIAESARWIPTNDVEFATGANPPAVYGRWVFSNGYYQAYDNWKRKVGGMTTFGVDGLFLVSDLTPELICTQGSPSMYMTFSQLRGLVQAEPWQAHLRVKLHNRLAYPLALIIVPAIGVAFLLIWRPLTYLSSVAVAILAAGGYFAVHLLLLNMGNVGSLNHVAAVWTPVFLFGAAAIFLLDMIKT